MDWTHHQRPVHAHIVHPSPVRAHSYPLTLYHESISSEFSKLDRFDSHDHNEPLTHHRPVPVHQWSYSSKSQAPQSPASLAHDLPSPPLSATMPDPWLTDRSDDQPEEWGGRQVLPPAPQIIPAPPTASGKTRTPVSPKRSLSPMSRKLLAPVTLEVWSSLMDKSKGRDKVLVCPLAVPTILLTPENSPVLSTNVPLRPRRYRIHAPTDSVVHGKPQTITTSRSRTESYSQMSAIAQPTTTGRGTTVSRTDECPCVLGTSGGTLLDTGRRHLLSLETRSRQ